MLFFKRLTGIIADICVNIEMLFLVIMTSMTFALVVSRYVFSYSFAWAEELTRYLMIWLAFLGAAALFKDNDHICMDLAYKKFPQGIRSIIDVLFGLIQIIFLVMLVKLGIQYSLSVSFIVSPTLRISMFWPTIIIPISCIIMIFIILYNVLHTILRLTGKSTSGI